MLALALGSDDDRAVFPALRHPDDVGHAPQEQPVLGLHAFSLREGISPVDAVVRKLAVDIAARVADDLIDHNVLAVAHARDDGHAGAQRPVWHGDGVLNVAPRPAAVLRGDERERLIESGVGVRALVRERNDDPAVGVQIDIGFPHGAERVKVLLDGRAALHDGGAELPRLAVIAADIEG